jgi:glycosyltransferase involved in cell wall biosynthesis
MKFCFLTTFFGSHSFGGDAIVIERLAVALLQRGHEVHVIYPTDAFNLLNKGETHRNYTPPQKLIVHALHSPLGTLSQIAIHQTGGLADLRGQIKALLDAEQFNVLHAHNISLIGGIGLLDLMAEYPSAIKLMTTHEHWLMCPLSVLWKNNSKVCEKPTCISCTIRAGRPPQWWRYSNRIPNAVAKLDALLSPSQYTLNRHQQNGILAPRMNKLPNFLPQSWIDNLPSTSDDIHPRPFFLAVGRLVKEKGYQTLFPAMKQMPDVDLLIAGDGDYRDVLKQRSEGLSNVHFLGYMQFTSLVNLYKQAIALIVPSLVLETFGNITIEALATGTPIIVRQRGALIEQVEESQGGLLFETTEQLVLAMQQLRDDTDLRKTLGHQGQQKALRDWSEDTHLSQYFQLIADIQTS